MDSTAMEMERIYVLKEYQGKAVGQILLDKAISLAGDADVKEVWLGVWEKNLKAINFYRRNGFVVFATHLFKLGTDKQTDLMMRIEIGCSRN